MKCPKCKYIAFDYLDICPRCGKDMSAEKTRLSISSIKPSPPFLLGSLTGELDDSGVEINVADSAQEGVEDMELKEEEIYDDGSDLELNLEEQEAPESSGDEEPDLGDLGSPEDDRGPEVDLAEGADVEEGGEERSAGEGEGAQVKETQEGSEEIDLDLDDLDLKLDEDEDPTK